MMKNKAENKQLEKIITVSGWAVELVVGNIDEKTAMEINEEMSWDEIEEIVGPWSDIDDIAHEYLLVSPPTFSEKNISFSRIESGVKEIPVKGDGYLMVTFSEEKGVYGAITVTSNTKDVSYYNKKYKIGESYMDLVEGFYCDGKDQKINIDDNSMVGKSVETIIYNRANKKQIWPKKVTMSSEANNNIVLSISPSFVYQQIEDNNMLGEDDIFSANCQEFAFDKINEFISQLNDRTEESVDEKVLINENSNNDLHVFDESIKNKKINYEDFRVHLLLKKYISEELLNSLFLDMEEFGFNVIFPIEGGQLISQSYDFGEYDTGYFADWCDKDDYIQTNDLEHIKTYNKAKEILLN